MSHRIVRAALTAIAAVALAGASGAAELVDVRIGTHPTYTRVVFELDGPGGYSISRQLAADGVPELLITMDAGSAPRSKNSGSLMVERVAVQEGTERAVAHIRLKQKPSRVKEMMLTKPPRLVFDFVYPEAVLAAREAAKRGVAKPTAPAPKVAKAEPKAEPKPAPLAKPETVTASADAGRVAAEQAAAEKAAAAKATAEKAAAEKAAAEKAAAAKATAEKAAAEKAAAEQAAAEKAAAAKATAEKAAAEKVAAEKAAAAKAAKAQAAGTLADAKKLAEQQLAADAKQPAAADDVTQAIEKAVAPELPKPKPTPPPAKPAASARTSVPPAPSTPESSGGVDWLLVAGVGAGVLALFVGFVLWSRRRSLPNDIDVTALTEDVGDADAAPQDFAMGVDEPQAADSMFHEPTPAASATDLAAGPGLFDDDSEKENDAMDRESPDLPMERTASELPTQMNVGGAAAAGAGGDVARMMRDMEARLVKLETRLDEANDARERLERQVTAQAEELRVQRAAIARTQRALRGMNRGEEDQATEPAIREPNS